MTGKEEAILRFTEFDKDDNETYQCEAKSHGQKVTNKFMKLIINCEYVRILSNQASMEVFKTIFL